MSIYHMSKRRIIQLTVITILGIIVFRFFIFPPKVYDSSKTPFILRVRLKRSVDTFTLYSKGKCRVTDAEKGAVLARAFSFDGPREVSPAKSGMKFGQELFPSGDIRISPLRGKLLVVDGRPYRGEIDVQKKDKGFRIINRVKLEDYLKGVLPREVYHFWPFATLKAQAIASRSFAAHQALLRKNQDYDLTADTFSQVYGGQASERWRTTKAVESTAGEVLEYDGKVLPAYFHSCCGGHTQNAANLWSQHEDPLRGVKCSWCRWSPYFRWRVRIPTKTILEKLKEKGYSFREIDDIRSGPRDNSKRVEYVRIRSQNNWFEVSTEDFRAALGRRLLKSSNFKIKKYPYYYLFSGYGWGHGVGMCQWGSFGLGFRRWDYERILRHYYPGTEIVNLSEVLRKER
ncbi:MAG: SpoIID/LytB domain-containing protein [Candidatus Omnitrophica bacterium]|nr:SpoIID/LytB domain-containing protein [Candidatus Omnitrophota bacterium]